jgi:hypothetical protein
MRKMRLGLEMIGLHLFDQLVQKLSALRRIQYL